MKVVSLQAEREAREPHWSGTIHCIGCKHEWEGVGPIGQHIVDCPACKLPKGHLKHPFAAQQGDLEFSCAGCGAIAMTAYKRQGLFRLRCMGCGEELTNALFGDDET